MKGIAGLLAQRDFALLFTGSLISGLGDWVLIGALPFYVYGATGSALAAGSLFVAQIAPGLVVGPLLGVFIDRWDRVRTLLVADVVRGMAVLALLTLRADAIWLLYVVAVIESSVSRMAFAARVALMPALVDRSQLASANALSVLSVNSARILGPPIGGLLLTHGGVQTAVLVDAASYFASASLLLFMRIGPLRRGAAAAAVRPVSERPPRPGLRREWVDGLQAIRQDAVVSAVFLTGSLAWLADGAVTAIFVVFVSSVVQAGPEAFGLLMSARGVGGIGGGLVVTAAAAAISPARMQPVGMGLAGLLLATLVAFPTLAVAIALMVLAGVATPAWLVAQRTMLQRALSQHYRGRVFGWFDAVTGAATLLGMGLASLAADRYGGSSTLLAAACIYLVAGGVSLVLLPRAVGPSAAAAAEVGAPPIRPRESLNAR